MIDVRDVPVAMTITAANIDERISIYDLLHNVDGLLIGDKGYRELSRLITAPLQNKRGSPNVIEKNTG